MKEQKPKSRALFVKGYYSADELRKLASEIDGVSGETPKPDAMKTGAELIAEERKEQIEKHGWDLANDQDYGKNELIKASLFCISPEFFEWPFDWTEEFRDKIIKKNRVGQLKVAGALIAAQIDRIQNFCQVDYLQSDCRCRKVNGFETMTNFRLEFWQAITDLSIKDLDSPSKIYSQLAPICEKYLGVKKVNGEAKPPDYLFGYKEKEELSGGSMPTPSDEWIRGKIKLEADKFTKRGLDDTARIVWEQGAEFAIELLETNESRLLEALEKIIEMNRQHAEDQYGDANKAESWSCVTVAREALRGRLEQEKRVKK